MTLRNSHAGSSLVRPFQLNRVAAEGACFPRANVADLAVAVVVPSLAGHGVGDGFSKLVRGGGSERVGDGQAAGAPGTSGIGHDRIENVAAGGFVIAAEILAGSTAPQHHLHAGGKEDKIQRIGARRRNTLGGDLLLQRPLNRKVLDRTPWSRRS